MIRNILVPTDFSPCSVNAVKYASQLARYVKAEKVLIMFVFNEPVSFGDVGVDSIVHQSAVELEEEIDRKFITLKKKVPALQEIPFQMLRKSGHVVDAVIHVSKSANIDLVVMGTKGATGMDEIIMGTHTYNVIKESLIPVLVIPRKVHFNPIKNIALASDYKNIEGEKLSIIKDLNWSFGTEIHLLHISDDEKINPKKIEVAKKYEMILKGVQHHYHYEVDEDVEHGINKYTKSNDIDVLTLIPRKHDFFDTIFGAGESKKLIFHTKIPLLAIPD